MTKLAPEDALAILAFHRAGFLKPTVDAVAKLGTDIYNAAVELSPESDVIAIGDYERAVDVVIARIGGRGQLTRYFES